jgi:hypothetical protein
MFYNPPSPLINCFCRKKSVARVITRKHRPLLRRTAPPPFHRHRKRVPIQMHHPHRSSHCLIASPHTLPAPPSACSPPLPRDGGSPQPATRNSQLANGKTSASSETPPPSARGGFAATRNPQLATLNSHLSPRPPRPPQKKIARVAFLPHAHLYFIPASSGGGPSCRCEAIGPVRSASPSLPAPGGSGRQRPMV